MSLANILDVCLEDIQSGAATIEECLKRYPEHAKDLAPLLAMALLFDEAPPPAPPPAFKADLRRQLMHAPLPTPSASATPALTSQPAFTPPQPQLSGSLTYLLDVCLEDIQSGAASVEDCLARYPEYAKDLGPLLTMAVLFEQAAPPPPSPVFKASLRRQLMDAPVPDTSTVSAPVLRPFSALVPITSLAYWRKMGTQVINQAWLEQLARGLRALLTGVAPRALAGATLVLFMAFWLSTSTFAAESLPGEPLYPVKRAGEQVRLVLMVDPFNRAQYHARLAEVRFQEARELAARGQTDRAQSLFEEAKHEEAQAVALGLQVTIVDPAASATVTPPTLEPPTLAPPTSTVEPSVTLTAPRPTASHTALPPATATRPLPVVAPTERTLQEPVDPPTASAVPPTVTTAPPTATLVPPTATLVPPTATEVPASPTAGPGYPVPPRATSAYPEPPRPTSRPPTDTPIPRPEQPTPRPLATKTNTPGVIISDPNATATHTPQPSATPTAQDRPQRTPVPLPSRTATTAPPVSATPVPATATTAPPATVTSAPPAPPSPTSQPLAAPTNTSPPPATTPAVPARTATSKP